MKMSHGELARILCGVLVLVLVFASGFYAGRLGSPSAKLTYYGEVVKKTSVDGVVLKESQNPCCLIFVFSEPIAPDFFVGYGLAGGYETFLGEANQEKWDPLGIGADRAMALVTAIREQVAGVTEDVCARGYELTIIFAESHLERRDELITEVEKVISDFLGQGTAI